MGITTTPLRPSRAHPKVQGFGVVLATKRLLPQ